MPAPLRHRFARLLLLSALPVLGLSACGGGGGGGGGGSATHSLSKGDHLTYMVTETPSGGSATTTYATQTITSQSGNTTVRADTNTGGGALILRTFNARESQTRSEQGSQICTRSVSSGSTSLQTFPSGVPALGTSWSYGISEVCNTGSTVSGRNSINGTGLIISTEELITAAGTFSTLKYRVSENVLDSLGNSQTHHATCWRDTDLGVVVRCEDTVTTIWADDPGTVNTSTVVTALAGMSVSQLGVSQTVLPRLAGAWDITLSGTDTGRCTVQVSTTGTVTGPSCYSDSTGAFYSLTGTVTAAGAITATASTGLVLQGELSSPLAGSGSWVLGTRDQGAWTAAHR